TGTFGLAGVTVPGQVREGRDHPVAARERVAGRHVDAVTVGLPGHQLHQRVAGGGGRFAVAEIAQHGHARRTGVVVEDVGADDTVLVEVFPGGFLTGLIVAGPAALVDVSLGVDQEVVADVVPAVALHVVGVDRPDRGRRVGVVR